MLYILTKELVGVEEEPKWATFQDLIDSYYDKDNPSGLENIPYNVTEFELGELLKWANKLHTCCTITPSNTKKTLFMHAIPHLVEDNPKTYLSGGGKRPETTHRELLFEVIGEEKRQIRDHIKNTKKEEDDDDNELLSDKKRKNKRKGSKRNPKNAGRKRKTTKKNSVIQSEIPTGGGYGLYSAPSTSKRRTTKNSRRCQLEEEDMEEEKELDYNQREAILFPFLENFKGKVPASSMSSLSEKRKKRKSSRNDERDYEEMREDLDLKSDVQFIKTLMMVNDGEKDFENCDISYEEDSSDDEDDDEIEDEQGDFQFCDDKTTNSDCTISDEENDEVENLYVVDEWENHKPSPQFLNLNVIRRRSTPSHFNPC